MGQRQLPLDQLWLVALAAVAGILATGVSAVCMCDMETCNCSVEATGIAPHARGRVRSGRELTVTVTV